MNPVIGVLVIVLPLLVYQDNPEMPFNRTWEDGQYRLVCILCGAIGGTFMARRENRVLGFRWFAGAVGGAITAWLSFFVSGKVYKDAGEASVNIFIILLCALPGFIGYLIIKRCSDYTFPDHPSHQSHTHQRGSSASGASSEYPAKQTTPLLIASRV